MIRDLSTSLRALLRQPGLPAALAAAQVVFDRPSDSFSPQQATVDMYLYDVRENLELRNAEPRVRRDGAQFSLLPAPLRVSCSYLVTAWPGSVTGDELVLQEHRLLSQVLQTLARYPVIPANFLQGSLAAAEPALPMLVARADGLANPHEFWTSLGGKLRPSLSVTVTLAMPVFQPDTAPAVIAVEFHIGLRSTPESTGLVNGGEAPWYRIGGEITDGAGKPVAPAKLVLVEAGLATGTDADGRYSFGMVPAGSYTLQVTAGASVKTRSIEIPVPHTPPGSNYNLQL